MTGTGSPSLLTRLLARARPGTDVSARVPTATLVGWYARKAGLPLLRGFLRRPLVGRSGTPIFVGGRVRIAYGRQVHLGAWVSIGGDTRINAYSLQGVHVGDRVTVREGAWIQCSSSPGNPGEGLWIGSGTYVGPGAVIGVGGPVVIGQGCQLGAGVVLIAENHAVDGDTGVVSATEVVRKGIRIGDGCWLGHRSTVVDGVTLGDGCVVAAGAVVTKSFPAGTRLAGVPARPL